VVDTSGGSERLLACLEPIPDGGEVRLVTPVAAARDVAGAAAVLVVHPSLDILDALAPAVAKARLKRDDGYPVLIAGLTPERLTEGGEWLTRHAAADTLAGVRLIVNADPLAIARETSERLAPFFGPTTIAMPVSTEVETLRYKHFYSISPDIRRLLQQIAEMAANQVTRLYLLGGPGTGKTSLAYYYYLARQQGKFVTVNLSAESSGDKTAMKSLLCGHVAGAFVNASNRSGAFTHARDGVCFLDESHGVNGEVMEVLMEALDSNQYLPLGASAKRPLECAVVFASNRTWPQLVSQLNPDEHARIGAIILTLSDLQQRPEDMMAVAADTMARLAARVTTWTAPSGFSADAWQALAQARWHGNNRSLIRVIETAFVASASNRDAQITLAAVDHAMTLWEPADSTQHTLYIHADRSGLDTGRVAE